MPRSFGVIFVLALATWALFGVLAVRAFANHVACGDVITQDTTLDSDLVDCSGHGIVIGADNVTLDLNGHTIDGDNASSENDLCDVGVINALVLSPCVLPAGPTHHGVTVRGGAIREFGFGIVLVRAADANVQDLEVSQTSGVLIYDSRDVVVRGNRLFENQYGVEMVGSSHAAVTGNRAWGNERGIVLEEVDHSRVTANVASGNDDGIRLYGGGDNELLGNHTVGNAYAGMVFYEGAHGYRVSRNTVAENGYIGIGLNDAGNNRVEHNRVVGNGFSAPAHFDQIGGILVNEDEIIERNLVVGNRVGISTYCCGSGGNFIARNRVLDNGDGVILDTGRHTLRRNRVSNNEHRGILLIGGPGDEPGSRVDANLVVGNGGDGIFVARSRAEEVLTGNGAYDNGDDGIDIETPNATVIGSRVGRNADLGIEAVPGVVDGGQNRAFRNGNPLQCLNVFCR